MPLTDIERKKILDAALKLNITPSVGWQNYSGFQKNTEMMVLDVEDTGSLQKILQFINQLNYEKHPDELILVRPAAGGLKKRYSESYSVHGVMGADVVIRLTGAEFTQIKSVNKDTGVVHIGASIQIGTLNKELYEEHDLTLPTSSLNPYITLIGLAATGGIGTGKDQPAITGLIQSLHLCLPDGKLVTLDKAHPDFNTIVSAHQGLFGFVLSAEVLCTEAKKMECIIEVTSLRGLIEHLHSGMLQTTDYTSILIIPQYLPDELTNPEYRNVRIYRWKPICRDKQDIHNNPLQSGIQQRMTTGLCDFFKIGEFLCQHPSYIPAFTRYISSPIAIGSSSYTTISPWYTSVHHQTEYPHSIEDTGVIFETGEDCKEVIAALEKVFDTLHKNAEEGIYPVIMGIYIRYLQGSNGGISITQHREGFHVCSLDFVSHNEIPGHDTFQKEMLTFFMSKFGARPHLGKALPEGYSLNCPEYVDALRKWYADNELELSKSILMTPHFRRLIKLDDIRDEHPVYGKMNFFASSSAASSSSASSSSGYRP
ncbi:TPA: FAD-binding protein [Legionella pneumophila]|nr:FAD-binding protein [Legionella pneumophila]HAT8182517.1 FAD-binding protein [Legionella pneumophila]